MKAFGKRQVAVYFGSVVLSALGLALVVWVCTSSPSIQPIFAHTELWLKYTYAIKDTINARPTQRQRLIIIGGSSNLFGFNGAMIEANTSYTFINYGTHGGLPASYHFDRIMQRARSGDIIFVSLNFDIYGQGKPTQDFWYITNMLSWDKEYQRYISTLDKLQAYAQLKILPTLVPLIHRQLVSQAELEQFIHKQILKPDPARSSLSCQNPNFQGYSYKSLSSTGDFCSQSGSLVLDSTSPYLSKDLQVSGFFISEYKRLESFAKAHNIKLFLPYPPTMENPLFSLKDKETHAKMHNLSAQLAAHNIHFVGDFRDFHYERKYFYDTPYHLNSDGANLRSASFIKLLLQLEKQGLITPKNPSNKPK